MPDHSENSIPTTARSWQRRIWLPNASGRLEGSYLSIYAQSKQPRGGQRLCVRILVRTKSRI